MTSKERESLTVQVALILVQEAVRHSPASNLRAASLLASEAAKAFVADLLPTIKRRTNKGTLVLVNPIDLQPTGNLEDV